MRTIEEAATLLGIIPNNFQLEAAIRQIGGENVFLIHPTGSGKSAAAQIPALIDISKTTIFIQPLSVLMEEQVAKMLSRQIKAGILRSEIGNVDHNNAVIKQLRAEQLNLLFLSPEKIISNKPIMKLIMELIHKGQIERVVFDEAHIIIHWGSTFRRSYIEALQFFTSQNVKFTFMTATATDEIVEEIIHITGKARHEFYFSKEPVLRPNIRFHISKCQNTNQLKQNIQQIVMRHFSQQRQRGVIFVYRKKDIPMISLWLHEMKITPTMFHSDYSKLEKHMKLQFWTRPDKPSVLVSSIAFSMGVDVPDIGFTIHTTMNDNMASLVQETGRAGRNGDIAHSYLLWQSSNMGTRRRLINSNLQLSPEEKRRSLEELYMVETMYTALNSCTWSFICNYFDDFLTVTECGVCEICIQPPQNRHIHDLTALGRSIIETFQVANLQVTMSELVQTLTGKRPGHLQQDIGFIERAAIGLENPKPILVSLISQLLREGNLRWDWRRSNTVHRRVLVFQTEIRENQNFLIQA